MKKKKKRDSHNGEYFVSYEPKSYCPNPPAACADYCITNNSVSQTTCRTNCQAQNSSFDETYLDAIITANATSSEPRTRYCNLIYPKTQAIITPLIRPLYLLQDAGNFL